MILMCVKCPTFLNIRLPISDKLGLILRYFNKNNFVDSNSTPSDNSGNNTHNNDIPNESETNLNINNSSKILRENFIQFYFKIRKIQIFKKI